LNKKSLLRREFFSKSKKISISQKRVFSNKVSQKLLKTIRKIGKKNAKSILFYLPLDIEPNILRVLLKLRKEGVDIFVPFIEGIMFKMVKFRLPLKKSQFGTLESGNSKREITRVDIVIVPILGADKNFQRVGFGKGMYDRFYETLKNRPTLIFVQNITCLSKDKITDEHDIRANYYITPDILLEIKDFGNNAIRNYYGAFSNRFCCFNNN
jgi:5-formyltetrahydrofolate cyclo-ligase